MAVYDRFWDIHLTASTQWYDFAANIPTARDYQRGQHAELRGNLATMLVTPSPSVGLAGPVLPIPLGNTVLPATGYVASAVTIPQIQAVAGANPAADLNVKPIVAWVSDPKHTGKIRFQAHGVTTGGGRIGMGSHARGNPARQFESTMA